MWNWPAARRSLIGAVCLLLGSSVHGAPPPALSEIFVRGACTPKEPRTLYLWNGKRTIRDVLPALLRPIASRDAAGLRKPPPGPLDLAPQTATNGQPRTFVVHAYPLGSVRLSANSGGATVEPQGQTPGSPFDLGAEAAAWRKDGYRLRSSDGTKPVPLLPAIFADKDPNADLTDDFLAPLPVVAAGEIVLSGDLDVGGAGVVLIADTIRIAGDTTIRSRRDPERLGPAPGGAPWTDTQFHSGQIYLIANTLDFAPGRKLRLDVGQSHLDQGDGWTYPQFRGYVAILSSGAAPAGAVELADWTFRLPPLFVTRTITKATFARLLRHYAPRYIEDIYYKAELLFQRRDPSAAGLYDVAAALGAGADPYGRSAALRALQVRRGLNYIGERDDVVPHEKVGALLHELEQVLLHANLQEFDRIKELFTRVEGWKAGFNVGNLDRVDQSLAEEEQIAATQIEAASQHAQWARQKIEADQKTLANLVDLKTRQLRGLAEERKNFQAAAEKACKKQEEKAWWSVIVAAITMVVNIATLDFPKIAKDSKGLFDSFKQLTDGVGKLAKDFKDVTGGIGPLADKIDQVVKLGEQMDGVVKTGQDIDRLLKSDMPTLQSNYRKLADHAEGCGVTWRLEGNGSFPSHAYPSVFEMQALDNQILAAGETIGLAVAELKQAQTLLEAASLRLGHVRAEIQRNAQAKADLQDLSARIAGAPGWFLEADAQNAGEQICRTGERMVERAKHLAYRASRGLAFLRLIQDDALGPARFPWTAGYFDGSWKALQDYVAGDTTAVNLTSEFNGTSGALKNFGRQKSSLGLVPRDEDVATFRKTGVMSFEVDASRSNLSGSPARPIRVANVHVILKWASGAHRSFYVALEKIGDNVYRFGDGRIFRLPMANVVVPDDTRPYQELVTEDPDPDPAGDIPALLKDTNQWSVDKDSDSPFFGLSVEGRWRLRLLDGNVVENRNARAPAAPAPPEVRLQDLKGVVVVFQTFGQS